PSKGCGSVEGIYCNQALANIIFQCQATCEYATTHLKLRSDTRARRDQLIVLRDCADICGTNCKFVPRGSAFDRQTVAVCACICEACANECSRFNDPLSQQCARICCQCAKACRAFVRGTY
ncbi:MAG: four-helix bundle copper-binding protein, partial [Clostridia bacterium]|nr:four-helix bundle copper-binding protein [Clostridia bacterium]